MRQSDIGIYGLGMMGRNLALNFDDKGFQVSVFNRTLPNEEEMVSEFLSGEAAGTDIKRFKKIEAFVDSLDRPRKILIMIKAGPPVDTVIDQLMPLLDKGDIVIDGGNSHYSDTNRRVEKLSTEDLRYVGMGISGGEEGARHGPSLMPGGDEGAWFHIQSPLKSIAAKSADGTPCCHWMGSAGAGHYVKMIHNGIEYATMQLIAECYQLMKDILDMSNALIGSTFDSWNEGLLESYLLEITRDIFAFRNDRRQWVLDIILDKAGQKGTGRWAAMTALELGIPAPVITEAVFARTMSGYKDLREQAAQQFHIKLDRDSRSKIIENLQAAMLGSFLVAFSEGFWLLKAANDEYGWDIPLAEVANAWKAGCIIRSSVLKPIAQAYTDENTLTHLLLAPAFRRLLQSIHRDWRSAICFASEAGSPIPAMSAALAHFDSLRTPKGPANLIQAQRDYFGAHHYERIDKPRGKFFHTDWQKI